MTATSAGTRLACAPRSVMQSCCMRLWRLSARVCGHWRGCDLRNPSLPQRPLDPRPLPVARRRLPGTLARGRPATAPRLADDAWGLSLGPVQVPGGGVMAAGSSPVESEGVATPVPGRAGIPTPSERQTIYTRKLREGELPPGWMARQARKWGLNRNTVIAEVQTARAALEASRTPDAAATQAHELIQQVVETAAEIDRDAILIDEPEKRAKTRALAAGLKLKAATELRNLYRKSSGLASEVAELVSGRRPALTDDALKG